MRLLIVIPTYNEALNVSAVVAGVRSVCRGDIAVIDDGSDDDTAAVAQRAGAVVLRHPCNLGIGAAVQTGFQYALQRDYDAVVRVDGDGQHDPAYIPALLAQLETGDADVVVGSRFLAGEGYQSTFVRRLGIVILGILSAVVGARVTDPTSGYWAVNRRALRVLARFHPDDYPETQSLLVATRAGCRIRELPVVMQARGAGRSSIGVLHSGFYMVKVILAVLIERLRPRATSISGR
ncbi:MAG TPA: glycosyltransferase family 2 protein [Candidatus Margulisiibacteriota bacterium]|nr:glycosyltransferase family 2 protein [Candidatus Margulisiibacteriota bacterium]